MLSPGERAQARAMEAMFRHLAPRYDLVNRFISLWQDRGWRRLALSALEPCPGGLYLDLACGSGALAQAIAAKGGRVVGLDLCYPMLRRAQACPGQGGGCSWLLGHALTLPFRSGTFDGVTIGFALRNIPNLPHLFQECHRVLKPGGRLVGLELWRGKQGRVGAIYRLYLFHIVPALGGWLSGEREAYHYLARSVLPFPHPPELSRLVTQAGFQPVRWHSITGGAVILLTGEKTYA